MVVPQLRDAYLIFGIADIGGNQPYWTGCGSAMGTAYLRTYFLDDPTTNALFMAEAVHAMLSYHRWWLAKLRPKTLEPSKEDIELNVDVPKLVSDMDTLDQQLQSLQKAMSSEKQDALRSTLQAEWQEAREKEVLVERWDKKAGMSDLSDWPSDDIDASESGDEVQVGAYSVL